MTCHHYGGREVYHPTPVLRLDEDGSPVYAEQQVAFTVKDIPLSEGDSVVGYALWNADRSRVYVLEGNAWYYKQDLRYCGLAAYSPDGKRLWRFPAGTGMDMAMPLTKPGEVRGVQSLIGLIDTGPDKAGELVGLNGYAGNFNVINEDGLFVAELCYDNRRAPGLGPNVRLPENFGGQWLKHPRTGRVYLYGGDSDARIWEIKGLDTLRRFNTSMSISGEDVRTVKEALATYRAALSKRVTEFLLRRAPGPVNVDGVLNEWNITDAPKVEAGEGRGGRALAAYDDNCLYLAFHVLDDSPFKNSGTDLETLFKTGDVADMILCTDPEAKRDRKAGKGDLRILFAPYQGKPTAVLDQKVADGGPPAPFKFTSSTGEEEYERIVVLADAKVAVQRQEKSYSLEAAVPLAVIGFKPESGKSYAIDFGILYSDTQGAKTIQRSYWANSNTAITGDIPIESRIEPSRLGTARIEQGSLD